MTIIITYFMTDLLHFPARVLNQTKLHLSDTSIQTEASAAVIYKSVPGAKEKSIWPRVESQSEKDGLHPQISMSESTLKSIWDHSKWETRVVWGKKAGCHACDLWLYKHRTLTFTWFLAIRPKLNMIITSKVWHWFHLLKVCQN